jgi:hypothetical protein
MQTQRGLEYVFMLVSLRAGNAVEDEKAFILLFMFRWSMKFPQGHGLCACGVRGAQVRNAGKDAWMGKEAPEDPLLDLPPAPPTSLTPLAGAASAGHAVHDAGSDASAIVAGTDGSTALSTGAAWIDMSL